MNPKTMNYIAIDIAKESLAVKSAQDQASLAYTQDGLESLQERFLEGLEEPMLIFEATGGYERALMDFCREHGYAFALVNPARVKAFIRSEGMRAKSDPIDAAMLLRFAQQKHPPATSPSSPLQDELCALMDRRAQLSEQLAREKNRLQKCRPLIKDSIQRSMHFIEAQIEQIDRDIEALIDQNKPLQQDSQRMQSVIGVGKVTAWTLLAYLPELKFLNRNQAVALAGLAPFARDSGKFKGRRHIQAGRAKVRRCLYMAAVTATRHNPVIKAYVEGLLERGKHYKMAIVAAMRKLLIHLQSLLKKEDFCLV